MGLISSLKKLFNKNIQCGEEVKDHFIYLYPSSSRIVQVGANIVVGEDFFAAFVCKDRVSDVLPPGKHKITGATLPKTFSKLKLDRANRRGRLPKKFKADIYYISSNTLEQQNFYSGQKFYLKSSKFGKVKGYVEGICDIKVIDAEKLLKVLLADRYYIKNKYGIKKVMKLVGDEVCKILEHSKLSFTQIILNPTKLKEYLNPAINEKLQSLGVEVYNCEISSLKLNKSLKNQVATFINERREFEQQFEQTGIKFELEQIVPDKVDVSDNNANTPTFSDITQKEDAQTLSKVGQSPAVIKRGGVVLEKQSEKYTSNINAEQILSKQDEKICKFCNRKININFAFCPKCGFKQ